MFKEIMVEKKVWVCEECNTEVDPTYFESHQSFHKAQNAHLRKIDSCVNCSYSNHLRQNSYKCSHPYFKKDMTVAYDTICDHWLNQNSDEII